MFSLREFLKIALVEAVGNMPDYQIRLNASGWYDKGVLTTEDMTEIEEALNNQQNEVVETEERNQEGDLIG